MSRRKNNTKDDPSRHVFTEVIAAVVFFMILFIFVQQLRFIEVFEKAKVQILQDYLAQEIPRTFEENNFNDRVPVISVDPNSPLIQKITMTNNALQFDSGEADFKTDIDQRIIELIGGVLNQNHTIIEALKVEGHTDNIPIDRFCYPSNWELSSARAATIVHHMTEVSRFPAEKISAVGFSQYHPIDKDSLHLNRRIEFIIRYSYAEKFMNNSRAGEIYATMDSLKRVVENIDRADLNGSN